MGGIILNVRKTGGTRTVGTLVRGDSNTTDIHFIVPRRASGVDLADLEWSVGIENADGETMTAYPDNVTVYENVITFDWYPAGIATSVAGITLFDVASMNGSDMVWVTVPYTLIISDNLGIERGHVDVMSAICGKAICGKAICGRS